VIRLRGGNPLYYAKFNTLSRLFVLIGLFVLVICYYFCFVLFFLDGPFLFLAVVLVLALIISILELLCHACAKKEPGIAWKAIFARDLVSILILLTSTTSLFEFTEASNWQQQYHIIIW
jgi:hypothetical protein